MPNTRPLQSGIKTSPQFTTFEEVKRVWLEAEQVPAIQHAWLFDHFVPRTPSDDPAGPALQAWTSRAALAALTARRRLGVMVTGNTYRHPAVLANMGATADQISLGWLDFGIGADWSPIEHAMYGIPLPSAAERAQRLSEACEVIRRHWTKEGAQFDGVYYHLANARCEPKPVQRPHPPFVIGGGGEKRTLGVVARDASIWNFEVAPDEMFTTEPIERFVRKSAIRDEQCARIGRDPAEITRSVQLFAEPTRAPAVREMLRSFTAAGATHLILMLRAPYPENGAPQLAEDVIEPVLHGYTQ
jgi:alkanesulfonate monooxygenase SsuD/methylene tetrahydromethanopterin reductase-like flavin-dependent oxidoreductase (luciferase family)